MHQETIWTHGTIPNSWPYMTADQNCEVAVVGGGLTGALCAWHLSQAGHDTLLVTSGLAGRANTAASLGILRADCGEGFQELIRHVGPVDALEAYRASQAAVVGLEKISQAIGAGDMFTRRPGVTFTRFAGEAAYLRGDFELLSRNGFNVEWIDSRAARAMFSFPIEGALLFHAASAEIDPYRLTHALLGDAPAIRVFENTTITRISPMNSGSLLRTATGCNIRARHTVIATGEPPGALLAYMLRHTHSVIATLPVSHINGWDKRALLSERASGICMRTDDENRLIIGANTAPLSAKVSGLLSRGRKETAQARWLKKKLDAFFPQMSQGLSVGYAFESRSTIALDDLPVIGPAPYSPGVYTVCGFGQDGATAGLLAGRLLLSWLKGQNPPIGRLYDPMRFMRRNKLHSK